MFQLTMIAIATIRGVVRTAALLILVIVPGRPASSDVMQMRENARANKLRRLENWLARSPSWQ